jgi:hypothetical protein
LKFLAKVACNVDRTFVFSLSGHARLSTQEARLLGVHSSEIPVHPQGSQGMTDEERLQRLVKTASLIGAYALAVA